MHLFLMFKYFFLVVSVVGGSSTTTTVKATSTTALEIGYFDASFNYLPINGSFVYRPSLSSSANANSSLLNVLLENRSVAVCDLDLSSFSSLNFSNNNPGKRIRWYLTGNEFGCSVVGEEGQKFNKRFHLTRTVNANETVIVRFGNENFSGCVGNFTIYNDDVVNFNCIPSTGGGRGDILSPFHSEHVAFGRHSFNVKCFGCGNFPTPGPFPFRDVTSKIVSTNGGSVNSKHEANFSSSSDVAANETETNVTQEIITSSTKINDNISSNVDNNSINLTNNNTNTSELRTSCDSNPCLNNGTCREIISNGSSSISYRCDCTVEFYGENCGNFNSCYDGDRKCRNGGVCVSSNDTTKCSCSANFTGTFCENELSHVPTTVDDPCASTPCLHNGTCTRMSATQFNCKCSPLWDGDKICSKPSATPSPSPRPIGNCTTNSQCNRGACQPDGTCDCTNTGFTGLFCQDDVDECKLQQIPCQHDALCNNTIGSYECICTGGYSGKNCSELLSAPAGVSGTSSPSSSSPNVGAIVGGIFGALAFIGLVVGGVFLFRYFQRSRKLKGKYNPAREEMTNAAGNPLPMSTLATGERLI